MNDKITQAKAAQDEAAAESLHFIFDKMPGPEGAMFIECEDANGKSVNAGEWRMRADGLAELVISQPSVRVPDAARDALARRCLWIAFCWNDHNFEAAHKEARKEAEKHGITSFDEANHFLSSDAPQAVPADVGALVEALEAARAMWGDYLPPGNSNAMKAMNKVDEALSAYRAAQATGGAE